MRAVSFSPDGLLLAVSRSDDELHIYDSRFMGRDRAPMRRFLHWGEDCCLTGDRWGIVDAVWVDRWCGKGLGVITGGTDGEISSHRTRLLCSHLVVLVKKGCIRFWDVRRSDDDISNGEVLARPNSDIGHFSVGDPYSGEKPLVVWVNHYETFLSSLMNLLLVVIMAVASMSTTTQPLAVLLAEHEHRLN